MTPGWTLAGGRPVVVLTAGRFLKIVPVPKKTAPSCCPRAWLDGPSSGGNAMRAGVSRAGKGGVGAASRGKNSYLDASEQTNASGSNPSVRNRSSRMGVSLPGRFRNRRRRSGGARTCPQGRRRS